MQKASAAQDATERKFLSKDFETDMREIRAECAKDAAMLITVKAAIHNKKAGCGARLYKGDKNVASLAQKHLAPACEQVTSRAGSKWVGAETARAVMKKKAGDNLGRWINASMGRRSMGQ